MSSPFRDGHHPEQFLGWALGAFVGVLPPSGFQIYVLIFPAALSQTTQTITTVVLCAVCGPLGSGLGYTFSYWFDPLVPLPEEPYSRFGRRLFANAFLYCVTLSLTIYSLLSFPLIPFVAASPDRRILLLPALCFISGFIAAASKGVLNNLWWEYAAPFLPPRAFDDELRFRR
jgi:hypothetical protein